MGRWPDVAPWGGPSADNFGDGDWVERELADRASGRRGVALHIAEGSYDGTIAWCRNPGSDISATFVSAKNGRAIQLVDTDDRPWTQGAGNDEWLSIEFEGRSGDALTPQQLEFAARVLAKAHQVYGVPLQLADSPAGRGLGWHGMGGAAWGGHTSCPGSPILAQRPAIIARAQQIVGGDDDMAVTIGGEPIDKYFERIERALWWPIPGIAAEVAALRAAVAEERTRDAGMKAALDAMAAALRSGSTGTPLDTAAVLARIDQRAAEVRELVEREHAVELAAARAEVEARTTESGS